MMLAAGNDNHTPPFPEKRQWTGALQNVADCGHALERRESVLECVHSCAALAVLNESCQGPEMTTTRHHSRKSASGLAHSKTWPTADMPSKGARAFWSACTPVPLWRC